MDFFRDASFLMQEYALIVQLHVLALFTKDIPRAWQDGRKGDVILISGFGEPWIFLRDIASDLNRRGYRIFVLPEFSYNFLTIETSVEIVQMFIEENHLKNVIFLTHSKGGIIAKAFMDKDSNSKITYRIISIAVPFCGTYIGYLQVFNLKELTPGNSVIKSLLSDTKNNEKIINLYAKVDNHIIPNKNAILPGAKNIQIDVVGHTRILEDKRTLDAIDKFL